MWWRTGGTNGKWRQKRSEWWGFVLVFGRKWDLVTCLPIINLGWSNVKGVVYILWGKILLSSFRKICFDFFIK